MADGGQGTELAMPHGVLGFGRRQRDNGSDQSAP